MAETEMEEDRQKLDALNNHTQKLQDDLQKLALKIKHHEDNLQFLKSQMNGVDESIFDVRVNLGKYHASVAEESNHITVVKTEHHTLESILQQEKAAAGIICQMKNRHGQQASKLPLTKDVLGVVATLGKVSDDNLSRLFSEYLGLETMLAIVCKTYEGVKALEKYDKEGIIDKSAGLHGLGPSIGRRLDGRFPVFCLETLRPYVGEFVADDDSQKKLAFLKPRLPNGECPPGFVDFAVNMIIVDSMHLSYLLATGHGLRETLFYNLFSRLQVYKTRADMQLAMPCISDGAVSLDGGMMKNSGLFFLGDRNDVEVRFPLSTEKSILPTYLVELEEKLKLMNWRKERLLEDMEREKKILNDVKSLFSTKKQEFLDYRSQTISYLSRLSGFQIALHHAHIMHMNELHKNFNKKLQQITTKYTAFADKNGIADYV